MILEGWTANVHCAGASTAWIDHTWVCSPENDRYFDCWGDHDGPNKRRVVVGVGSYDRAHCYRCSFWPFADTAGIGIFAIDGVCHQSTNCFLYTANRTLDFTVRGYWFSLFSYGTFGRSYRRWLGNHYGRCSHKTPSAEESATSSLEVDGITLAPEEEDPAIRIVREVYESVMVRGTRTHPNELLADEVAAVTKVHVPDIDPSRFRGIHMEYLRRKDELIVSGHKNAQLARRLDELARRTQKEIAKRMGREHYERLMGVPPDVTLGLVVPDLAEAAGVPMPPQGVIYRQSSRADEAGSYQDPDESFRATLTRWSKIAMTVSVAAGARGQA
jgi:hypothetical protein